MQLSLTVIKQRLQEMQFKSITHLTIHQLSVYAIITLKATDINQAINNKTTEIRWINELNQIIHNI